MNVKWNEDSTISVTPPAKPKKVTGTRFGAILGKNKWTSPFNAWCAITKTYEEPFEDTIYTKAGKIIEPKQAEYIKDKYFWKNLLTPTDKYGEDYFKKTWGDFFPEDKIFGGMWDYLFTDKDGKPNTVLEMKTTKRVEDWVDDIPEYYALQAALYAYLLGVDDVIMVCTVLEDQDYKDPENFEVNTNNTFEKVFKVSERYPDMDKTIKKVQRWWKKHVEGGLSPTFDEKVDADILKILRANTVSPTTVLEDLISEAELLEDKINSVKLTIDEDEKRLKVLKDQIKEVSIDKFRDGDKEVIIAGNRYSWVTSRSVTKKIDEAAMKADGVLDKYKTKETTTFRLTLKENKE